MLVPRRSSHSSNSMARRRTRHSPRRRQRAMRASAIRALADRTDQLQGVSSAIFLKALGDADPDVQVQAIHGLVRLGAASSAGALLPLVGSSDQGMSHLAIKALVTLDASDAALKALDRLTSVHDRRTARHRADARPATVTALMRVGARRPTPTPVVRCLLRLHVSTTAKASGRAIGGRPIRSISDRTTRRSGRRARDSCGTRGCRRRTSGDAFTNLVNDLALNGVLPAGSTQLLATLTTERSSQRTAVIQALTGRQQIDDEFVGTLSLDAQSRDAPCGRRRVW